MKAQEITRVPFEITESGRYTLGSDLEATEGEYALKISASNVSLDLRGFTLKAAGTVAVLVNEGGFALFNGTIQAQAITLTSEPHCRAPGGKYSDLVLEGDVHLPWDNLIFERCRVSGWSYGIHAGPEAFLSHCQVSGATLGIEVGPGSSVLDCQVEYCEDGVYALAAREKPGRIERTQVLFCRGLGLRLDGPGEVVGCHVRDNGRELETGGILAGPGALVRDCEALDNLGGDINVVEPTELRNNKVSPSRVERGERAD